MKMFATLLLSFALVTASAYAHEHDPGTIKGDGIDLFEKNHAFAGQILENAVFGGFDHQPFGAKVTLRKGEKTLQFSLEESADTYAGTISEMVTETGAPLTTQVELVKVVKTGAKSGEIILKLDQNEVVVKVVGQDFQNGHFIAPTYEATLGSKKVQFHFTGQACFGYSANITMMILSSYAHLLK